MNTLPLASTTPAMSPVGDLVRSWRQRRRLSQLELAMDAGLSTRHLSFIETGRSCPSPEVLMAIAQQLDIPLRERNTLLLAAGYAPRYPQRSIHATAMQSVRDTLTRLLDAHQPYPGLVLDGQWNVVLANNAALTLAELLPDSLRTPTMNIYRASLHPDGLARFTRNLDVWATHLLGNLRRSIENTGDPALIALEAEILEYPRMRDAMRRGATSETQALLAPCVLDLPAGSVSMFTTLTSFGTPQDVTLQELCMELFYPSDAASEQLLRALAA